MKKGEIYITSLLYVCKSFLLLVFFIFQLVFVPFLAHASITDGTIDTVNKFATWQDSTRGVVNFAATNGNIHVTDSGITGYAWADQFGWINLSPTNGGVHNDGNGTLSGYAWGQGIGWLNFKPTNGGVTIDTSGNFSGYAWSSTYGWLIFNCASNNSCSSNDFKVNTDWRPRSVRPACNNGIDDDGDGAIDYPADAGCSSLTGATEVSHASGGSAPGPGIGGIPAPTPTPTPIPNPNPIPEENPPPVLNPPVTTTPPGEVVEPPSGEIPTGTALSESVLGEAPSGAAEGLGQNSVSTFINDVGSGFNTFITGAGEEIAVSYVIAKTNAVVAAAHVRRIVTSPSGSVVTKTVTATGVAVGAVSSAAVLFTSPLTFSELFFIPFRLWGLLLAAFGLKRRFPPWGVVYDSVTKQPLDPAQVVVRDMMGKTVGEAITDLDGRYGFLLPPGMYTIEASKTHYEFPSKKLTGKTSDDLYRNLYFGERFEVPLAGPVVQRNIPLDPIGFDWNEFAKQETGRLIFYSRRNRILARISNTFFQLGMTLSLVATLVAPSPYNIFTFILYLILLAARIFGNATRSYGTVMDSRTKAPLSFGVIRVFLPDGETRIAQKVADKFGRYFCLVPKGEYTLTIERKNPDESYTKIFSTAVVNAKEGIIRNNFTV